MWFGALSHFQTTVTHEKQHLCHDFIMGEVSVTAHKLVHAHKGAFFFLPHKINISMLPKFTKVKVTEAIILPHN